MDAVSAGGVLAMMTGARAAITANRDRRRHRQADPTPPTPVSPTLRLQLQLRLRHHTICGSDARWGSERTIDLDVNFLEHCQSQEILRFLEQS
jgi:hypothetical protein